MVKIVKIFILTNLTENGKQLVTSGIGKSPSITSMIFAGCSWLPQLMALFQKIFMFQISGCSKLDSRAANPEKI